MRLSILTEKLSLAQRLQLRLIKRLIGHEVGPIAMQSYRPDFFGRPFNECVVEALRSTTFWTKAEAELFAAFVSRQNACRYCSGAHRSIAVQGFPVETVDATLTDWRTAPVRAQIRAILGFLEKLTIAPETVNAADIYKLYETDITEQGVREAIYICFVFCTINRLADAFDFEIPSAASYRRLGFTLYTMGYSMAVLPGYKMG